MGVVGVKFNLIVKISVPFFYLLPTYPDDIDNLQNILENR